MSHDSKAAKSDAKFAEKLICCFKNDTNSMNFDLSIAEFQKLALNELFWTELYNI